ncbi:galactokinase [Actinomadura sp. NPDC047616]|uniref:galactokinase n=1 Tax=Actinomadura sp. NPDC047616 TaxID=3155914 RepID=UPI0033D9DC0E
MTASDPRALAAAFTEAYRRAPEGVWRAPGRVNVIGEHTDYNDGFVLPFALPQGVSVAAARRDDGVLEVRSLQAADTVVTVPVDPHAPEARRWRDTAPQRERWAAYPAGTAWVLREHVTSVPIGGASLLIDADLLQGAGLSSSAALECATALALCELYGEADLPTPAGRRELARLAQRAEHEYVGMPCGIMDQSASLLCTAGHALMLDCRSGLSTQVPLPLEDSGLRLLVVDTRMHHELVDGDYGRRRAECERAAELLGVAALRDVKDLPAALKALDDPVLRRRVQHVVTENHRVEAAVGLLRAGATAELGAMLTASHLSLRDQFEISWPGADVAVEEAQRAGARGGRMVGGGFGGSAIVLTPADRVDRVSEAIRAAYERRGWEEPRFLTAVAADGARRLL